jgi:hypothetical protein
MSSSDAPISPAVIRQKAVELRERVSAVEDELNRLRTELEWWETGQRLFGDEGGVAENGAAPPDPAPSVKASHGKGPSLRQAILLILGEEPRKTWKTDQVIAELRRREWFPSGDNAEHHTRSMLAHMHRKGQARRMARGAYRLPPEPKDSS